MSDVKVIPPFLAALHLLPLWILVGLALAGYGSLFLPGFGGVDLAAFRKQWGWLCWLDAIVFTVLSATYTIDLLIRSVRARARRARARDKNRYQQLYAPLYAELIKIRIVTSSAILSPFFSLRAARAWREFRAVSRLRAVPVALRMLFDKQVTKETGEVEYGGSFPISKIENLVHSKVIFCDDKLLDLTERATTYRFEEHISLAELSYRDVLLYDHIMKEHERLKKRAQA